MSHIVLIGPAYMSTRCGPASDRDREPISTELLEALADREIELWRNDGPNSWYPRVVRDVPGKLLTRTGELAPDTSLLDLLARWKFDPTDMLSSGWGPLLGASLERITVTSHVTAAIPSTVAPRGSEMHRDARLFFPVSDEASTTSAALCALVRDAVAWETLGLVDDAVPHRRWRADDPRTRSTCDVMLRLLALLARGDACLAVTESIRACDIFGAGAELQIDPEFPVYHHWKIERDGHEVSLAEVLRELVDAGAREPAVLGPGRRWILAVIEDRPFLWAELVEKIEEAIVARAGDEVGWFSRLRRVLTRR